MKSFSVLSMAIVKTDRYIAKPSDNQKWVIIESSDGSEIDVEFRLMDYHYDCIPKTLVVDGKEVICSQFCCYTGCYITPDEIKEANKILPKIRPYLQKDAAELLHKTMDQIFLPDDYDKVENLYKTRCAPEEWDYDEEDEEDSEKGDEQEDKEEDWEEEIPPVNHCVFLMKNGLCATHKYYVDKGINWVKKKFNICTTFPIDVRPQDKTLAFMDEFDSFTYANVDCISPDENHKMKLGMPQIIESMKYVIVDRYGEIFWTALNEFAKDFRAEKVSVEDIYHDTDIAE